MIASTARRVAAKLRGSSLPRSSLNFLRRELERLQEKFKKRSERIAELEKQVQEKEKELADAQKKIAEQEKQITEQERQLALRKRNSTNFSKPPSSDGLAGEQRPRGRKHKSQRKPSGQPGHPGHHRPLIPTAEVNVLKVLLPEEVRGNFGPHLTALIAYWTVVCRVPRRLVEAMRADVLGLEISLGSTQKAWEEVSQAVEQPCQQLQEQLPREAVLNVDETGWRSNGDKRWIWTFVAKQFVFYAVASTRSAAVLVALLGAVFRGILCSDRWRVYLKYHSGRMHLKRNILGIADNTHSPSAQQFCRDALAVVARLPTMRRSGHCG